MICIRRLVAQRTRLGSQRGITLVESLIAVTILTIAGTAYLSALSTSLVAIAREDRRVTAESLAWSQLEDTRSRNYVDGATSYPTIAPVPQPYTVAADATPISGRDNIQKITVTVQFRGRVVRVLEDLKVDR